MNKVWFIFRGDHHLGPFSAREILRMYEEGKITGQTLLWAEGDSGWKALHLQERLVQVGPPKTAARPKPAPVMKAPRKEEVQKELQEEVQEEVKQAVSKDATDDLPPELPPLPVEDPPPARPAPQMPAQEGPRKSAKPLLSKQENLPRESGPPAFTPPPEAIAVEDDFISESEETEVELHPVFTDLLEGQQDSEIDSFYEDRGENKKTPIKWRWPLRGVALLMLLILSYQILFTNVGPFKFGGLSLRRLPGLSRDIEQQLHRFSSENRGQFKVTLALGHKGQVIWLSSGLLGQGMMRLRLTSRAGELLGSDQIEAQASAPYYGGAALFDNFKFLKGQGLIPGRYDAYLTYRPSGFWDGLKERFNELMSRPTAGNQVLKFTYLYYLGPNDQFDQALADYKNNLAQQKVAQKQAELAPLKLHLEFQSTLKELGQKVMSLYEESLAKMKRGRDIAAFTTRYAREIEPLYRPLTLESKAKMEDPMASETQRLAWEEIHKDYRSLGELVSDMQSMTAKRNSLSQTSKDRLLRIFRARASEITAKAQSEMAKIMESIDPGAAKD